jgi:hypothetical protein
MIYEFPEEFIVPVVYVKDLKDNDIYRDKKFKALHEDKLLIPDQELQGDGIFLAEIDIYGAFQNKNINDLKMEGELLQEFFQEPMIKYDIVEESLKDENIKGILSDIDEEYANNETLSM